MNALKSFFRPLQPTIGTNHSRKVWYKEFQASKDLEQYIFCYWELKSIALSKESFKYRVVSDGCVDILVDVKEGEIFITGFSKQYLEYDLGTSFHYVGIRFYPFMFPLLFGISAEKVINKFLKLEYLLPTLSSTIKYQLAERVNTNRLQDLLGEVLISYIDKEKDLSSFDPRFSNAVDQILKSGGNTPINQLDIALSQRQLRRFFQFYFGKSPKVFAKIFRFQNILNAKPSIQSLKSEKVFYDKGYYDQAHFIKDFKRFYGVTPSEAFGR
ncbi:helix-turn-helix domain-containing protein [uncultured Croceitalea sp.]|uniref:AraC family transcriptional regulator n=1 Tax=uncultured Croceitalea sp. TaxID=1798908 RepID=UPI003305D108